MSLELDTLRSWAELKAFYSDISWLIPEWLPNGYVTMLAADPGVGKSLMALTVCKAILQGGKILGHDMPTPPAYPMQRILWVEAEAGEPFHMARAQLLGINPLQIVEPRFTNDERVTPSLANASDRERISMILHHDHVRFCVLDSLSAATAGIDENSSQAAGHIKWLSELARDTGKPILVIHHMNKATLRTRGSSAPTLADIRGTSAILQHARVIWALDNPQPENPAILRVSCPKSNLGKRPDPIMLQNNNGHIIPYTGDMISIGKQQMWYDQSKGV